MRKPLLSLVRSPSWWQPAAAGIVERRGRGQPPAPGSITNPRTRRRAPARETPYGGVTFQDPGTNPATDPDEDRVSTFAMDVDTASYTIAQRYVADGNMPDPASVRSRNGSTPSTRATRRPEDATFARPHRRRPDARSSTHATCCCGSASRPATRPSGSRPEAALTFVIDTSGSMAREDRLELVKDSLRKLVRGLGRGDSIAVVTFGDDARVVLPPTRATDEEPILSAIDELQPGGSTNLEAGLAARLRARPRDPARATASTGSILASDGVANVGLTDADGILRRIRDDAAAGIELVSVGVGMGNYNDALLEQLADQGDGFYAYVNDRAEARRLFTEDLTGTLQTVALDAKVQVEFDPDVVASYRLIGYENRAIADRDFRDPRVDAGAIGAGHAVTALYDLSLREGFARDDRARHGPAALDGARGAARVGAPERDPSRRPGAAVRGDRPDLPARRGRGAPRPRRSAARRGSDAPTCATILDVAREDGGLPATDQVHDFVGLLERMAELGG